MKDIFTVIPRFLKDPTMFYQSIRNNENLKGKALELFVSTVVFLMLYGFVTGLSHHTWEQALSTALKMPMLFLLTLAFTLPALYFFALALLNIRFSVVQASLVVLTGVGVSAFLLLGLSPVTLFFVLTSNNYPFFQLLAVVFVALSGLTGIYYILRGYALVDQQRELANNTLGVLLLRVWVVLYAFVGAQMTWRLSPFIGDPQQPFVWLQPSRDNFIVDVWKALQHAFGFGEINRYVLTFVGVAVFGAVALAVLFSGWRWLNTPKALPVKEV